MKIIPFYELNKNEQDMLVTGQSVQVGEVWIRFGSLQLNGDRKRARRGTVGVKIMQYLQRHGPSNYAAISEAVGYKINTKHLGRVAKRTGKGLWGLK